MNFLYTFNGRLILLFAFLLTGILACDDMEDDSLPITNDFRVLQLRIDGSPVTTGVNNVSVISQISIVLSHPVDQATFEGALSLSPAKGYTITYDGNNSIANIDFEEPLEYETEYTLSLPAGNYGNNGETSQADYSFVFSTAAFEAPPITLSSDRNDLFETETLTITATIPQAILRDVSMDLVFGGSAVEGEDYTISANSIEIPAGSTSSSITISAISDQELEGAETITISLENIENGTEMTPQLVEISLGDLPPSIELKGVMSFRIGGTSNNGRAIHLRVLEDIADLSEYGIGIANNGGGSDGREIDFPAISVSSGDDILLVRDQDRMNIADYFGEFFNDYDEVIESGDVNFNGDDPFELYKGDLVIETYGDVELDGTGEVWEWTGSWAYKLNGEWEYAGVDCSTGSTSTFTSDCPYPFCVPLQIQGALAILWDGSGTNGGKAVHLRANRAIEDITQYGVGVANNGGGSDGLEFALPSLTIEEGDHILIAREPATIASYFGACYDAFDHVVQSDAMNQNGDDAVELFQNSDVIETYGDANVDGTDQFWEYSGAWGYKIGGSFIYGGVDCAAGSTATQTSPCPYPFCE
ncbi:MAG TPA: Ig-like domain-containing protein [Phaeodactylibacter sp.]|nr:Ig-like domain-containing protein [Phaeodactylibacter sp.]